MLAKQAPTQPLLGSKKLNIGDRANQENKPDSSPGPLSWCVAQRALPELKYVLTSNGYVVLP